MTDLVDDDDFAPFRSETAAGVVAAAQALATAVAMHAERVAAVKRQSDMPAVFQAGDELVATVAAYVDAQFAHTGTEYPLGAVLPLLDEDEDEADDEDPLLVPTRGRTVLRRMDFGVESESALISAGRTAYGEVWPDDDEEDAATDVADLGRALYQIAHARGWDALESVDGLVATAAATVVLRQEELLGPDVNDWPENPFEPSGDLLFSQADTWH